MRTAHRKPLMVEESRRHSACNPASSPHEVTVLFDNAALTFSISADATYVDLAARIAKISALQRGRFICVAVKLSRDAMKPHPRPERARCSPLAAVARCAPPYPRAQLVLAQGVGAAIEAICHKPAARKHGVPTESKASSPGSAAR